MTTIPFLAGPFLGLQTQNAPSRCWHLGRTVQMLLDLSSCNQPSGVQLNCKAQYLVSDKIVFVQNVKAWCDLSKEKLCSRKSLCRSSFCYKIIDDMRVVDPQCLHFPFCRSLSLSTKQPSKFLRSKQTID